MSTARHQAIPRRRTVILTVAPQALIALTIALAVGACGSSGSASTSSTATATVAEQTCQQVGGVLSNGPDPDADPVGYAEAQIQPLRQIHTADATLGQAITVLATAYNGYFAASGKSATAKAALTAAVNKINALCPDAGASL